MPPVSSLPLPVSLLLKVTTLIGLVLLSQLSAALSPDSAFSLNDEPQFLTVEEAYPLSVETLSIGGERELLISWNIADGYYLYKNKLLLRDSDKAPLDLIIPEGLKKYDDYFEEELEVFYNDLQITAVIPASPGEYKIRSQGCADAGLCYPPQWQTIVIDDSGNAFVGTTSQPTPSSLSDQSDSSIQNGSESNSENKSVIAANTSGPSTTLLLSLFGALLGGLILNLMPCVFPVLSLKALSFANSQHSHHEHHMHGWAYTLGTVATFVLIAAALFILRASGELIGWGFQLQNPLVVGALVYLFFFMGLLLFGSYNVGAGLAGVGQSLTEGQSLKSSFFTGSLATVVASPCTAPFMGTALGFAFTQPPAIGLLIFVFLGLGMALPFLLLSYYPNLSNKLPKPGPWMETLRQLLSFPLFLTAIWLLWVLGRQAGSDAIIILLSGGVAITLALWFQQQSKLRWVAIPIFILALLPFRYIETTPTAESDSHSTLAEGWQPYQPERLAQLLDSGTPVFVNLTADWCITCLANEKVALDTAATKEALDRAGYVKLKGDWTNYNPEITQLLSKYGRSGVPLYLLFTPNAGDQPMILPQILNPNSIINALNDQKPKEDDTLAENNAF